RSFSRWENRKYRHIPRRVPARREMPMEVTAPLDGPAGVSVLPQALAENLQGEGGNNPLRVLRLRQHPAEEEALPQPSEEKSGLPQLLGERPAFPAAIRTIPPLAQRDANPPPPRHATPATNRP